MEISIKVTSFRAELFRNLKISQDKITDKGMNEQGKVVTNSMKKQGMHEVGIKSKFVTPNSTINS
jgi:hypothetical protein